MELFVYETPDELAANVAAGVSKSINSKANNDGARSTFTIGLAGGSTPKALYKILRNTAAEWISVVGWLGDERWVPHGSDRSNGRMAAETLFDHVGASLLRPDYRPSMDPNDSADRYSSVIHDLHPNGKEPDLILLGLGEDGHTASLFPGSDALDESERPYVANRIPESGEVRLTATYPLIRSARKVIFLVVGDSKAEALRDSLAGETPAGMVDDGTAGVEWHVDQSAASKLP